jgi:hypothetical protein
LEELLNGDARRKLFDIHSTGERSRIVLRIISKGNWNIASSGQLGKKGPDGYTVWRLAQWEAEEVGRALLQGRGEAPETKRYVDKPIKRLEPFSSNRSHEPIYPGRDFVVVGRVHRVIVDL